MTYLTELSGRFNAQSHHAFLLHGGTRDLQIGAAGSCTLVDHIGQVFSGLDQPRLVATFRYGVGWSFVVDSDQAKFKQIVGLDQAAAGAFSGLTSNESEDGLPLDPSQAIGLVDLALRQDQTPVVIVIDRAEFIAPMQSYDRMQPSDKAILSILQRLASDRAVADTRNILIMVTDSLVDLHESLRLASSRFYAIEIAPPDYNERLEIASQVFDQLAGSVDLGLSVAEFSQATSMMTRYGLMDIFLDAKSSGALTKEQVRTVKAKVLSQEYGDILEMLDPLESGFAGVAGLEKLKVFFSDLVNNMISANIADVPTGVLFAGAAGLGKSYFMRGVAGQCGLPVINFNVGRLLGSFVGQSERNLERALLAVRSAAPCLVVLDEIETTFPDRSTAGPNGDSGVSSRILKRMLEELSTPSQRGRVCWIGITNFPQKLDAALSRAGRFDITVAFLPPSQEERETLLTVYAGKYAAPLPAVETLRQVASDLIGYTNAEIENIARKARQIAKSSNDQAVIDLAWRQAVERVRANTRDVASMTNAALLAVNDADLLPSEFLDQWRQITGQSKPASQATKPASKALF